MKAEYAKWKITLSAIMYRVHMVVWPTGIKRGGRSWSHLYLQEKEGKEKLMDYCNILLACLPTSVIAPVTSVLLYVLLPERSL